MESQWGHKWIMMGIPWECHRIHGIINRSISPGWDIDWFFMGIVLIVYDIMVSWLGNCPANWSLSLGKSWNSMENVQVPGFIAGRWIEMKDMGVFKNWRECLKIRWFTITFPFRNANFWNRVQTHIPDSPRNCPIYGNLWWMNRFGNPKKQA